LPFAYKLAAGLALAFDYIDGRGTAALGRFGNGRVDLRDTGVKVGNRVGGATFGAFRLRQSRSCRGA
jgi:hypothetical protein